MHIVFSWEWVYTFFGSWELTLCGERRADFDDNGEGMSFDVSFVFGFLDHIKWKVHMGNFSVRAGGFGGGLLVYLPLYGLWPAEGFFAVEKCGAVRPVSGSPDPGDRQSESGRAAADFVAEVSAGAGACLF